MMIRESELPPDSTHGGVLLGILGGGVPEGVPTGSPNPDRYLELASKIHTLIQTWRHYLD